MLIKVAGKDNRIMRTRSNSHVRSHLTICLCAAISLYGVIQLKLAVSVLVYLNEIQQKGDLLININGNNIISLELFKFK